MKLATWLLTLATLTGCTAHAQQTACPLHGPADQPAAQRCLYFTLERFGAMVPAYTLAVRGDGQLKYWENADPRSAASERAPWLTLAAATVATVFAAEDSIRSGACMAHVRNLGFGAKVTMTAWSPAGYTACSFVSTSEPAVLRASSAMQAVAEMLQGGERVDRDHHGDRLALERDLDELIEKTQAGKAIEPQLIAPALNSIADDDALIDRVRQKAAALLHPSSVAASSAR